VEGRFKISTIFTHAAYSAQNKIKNHGLWWWEGNERDGEGEREGGVMTFGSLTCDVQRVLLLKLPDVGNNPIMPVN
jgi:hypothetical protein